MSTKKDLFTFEVHFQCKCQAFTDINKFIKTQINPAKIKLLCPVCERVYIISLTNEEIK